MTTLFTQSEACEGKQKKFSNFIVHITVCHFSIPRSSSFGGQQRETKVSLCPLAGHPKGEFSIQKFCLKKPTSFSSKSFIF
jgi:hypothetical protein